MATLPSSPAVLLNSLPPCGLDCLVEAVTTQSRCNLTDVPCVCANQAVQATAGACVLGSCTIPEALTTQKLTNELCGITPHQNITYTIILYTFAVTALIFVALRFVARLFKHNPLWWDDYAVLLSVAIAIAFTVLCGVFGHFGVGFDMWAVPQQNISTILILFWTALLCYPLSRFFVRVSISLFLIRIFRVSSARPLLITSLILNGAITITYVFCVIFQCTPVPFFWDGWNGLHKGFCVDRWAIFLSGGIVTTSLDIFLIVLPMRWVFRLQLSRAKKITTVGMLSLGVIVVVASIMRIVALYSITHSSNITGNLPRLAIWGGLELDFAIICACLPSLRPLFAASISNVQSWRTGKSGSTTSPTLIQLDKYNRSDQKIVSNDVSTLRSIGMDDTTHHDIADTQTYFSQPPHRSQ
ncbi:hypothetical protein F5Y09DRAFT_317953 [Xylaria sp. FL1042]|nr:hypothetical protein F5Y09DRAFT_317953 [Xylaria sp. FL1042]